VFIGSEPIITGTIEVIEPGITATDRQISVQGRSLPGVLVDCNIEADGWEFQGLTLFNLAREFCAPFSIPVVTEGPDTDAIFEIRAEPGQRYFDFLKQVADARGKLITDDRRGRLVISTPTIGGDPVAAIVEGDGPVVSVSARYDGTRRYSKYTVMTQFAGVPDLHGTSSDRAVTAYRPFARVGSFAEFEDDIDIAADWERRLALSRSVSVSAVIKGWRHSSGIWTPGDVVTLNAPSAYILRETRMIVAGVTLRIDESDGLVSELRLILPETYAGDPPSRYPWEE